jgi:uncharacterized delta-60 repeat protein
LLLVLSAICSLLPTLLYSQSVDTAWTRRYNGPGNSDDFANAIAVDGQGNVYVTGLSYGSNTDADYATIKYNSAGVQQWLRRYNGPGNDYDYAYAIAVDSSGNVYVTGYSTGSTTLYDYATIKYNSNGDTLWLRRYNGPGNSWDEAFAIAVDSAGNVYVTGYCSGNGTGYDYTTIKYNSAGTEQWVNSYNGPISGDDVAYAIAVDGSGNVYVTGKSSGSGTSYDYVTIMYNSAGVQQWLQIYDGPGYGDDYANAIALDDVANVYVTGYSFGSGTAADCATIKYNSAGVQEWVQRYNGPGNSSDWGKSLVLDGQRNVYVTGSSIGSGTSYDIATIKYDSAGVQEWVQRYNGPANNYDLASAMAIDDLSNIYVTGSSYTSINNYDYATIKYDSAGVQDWAQRYNVPGNGDDWAYALTVDGPGNVYVTGESYTSSSWYDYATVKYVQTSGIEEVKAKMEEVKTVEVFPNPAKTYFNISFSLLALHSTLKLYDVTGKIVKSEELKGKNNRVSLDGIKNGVYFVRMDNAIQVTKIIVTR